MGKSSRCGNHNADYFSAAADVGASAAILLKRTGSRPPSTFTMMLLLCILSYACAISLSPSPTNNGTAVVPDFVSFSIEFWCFSDYAGNASQQNTFFQQLLHNLKSLTGKSPAIRIGGTSCDTTIFNSSLPTPSQIPSNSAGTFQPANVTYGPKYFDSFNNFANDTEFTFGINLALNTSKGLPNAKNEAQAAMEGIGGNLKVLEWGNEPDLYSAGSLRPADYNQSSYVKEWLAASSTINSSLNYQFGSAGRMPDEVGGFQFETLLDYGINSSGHAKVFSQHVYFFGQTTPGLSLAHLMNHSNTISTLKEFVLTAKDAQAQGVMYILGETSSVSTGGTHGISDVYGASLWVLDYLCYSASHGKEDVLSSAHKSYRFHLCISIHSSSTRCYWWFWTKCTTAVLRYCGFRQCNWRWKDSRRHK